MAHHVVQAGQHGCGIIRVERVRAEGVSDASHHGGRVKTMPDDVTDRCTDMTRRELEDVVPVTTDEAIVSRDVACGDLQPADLGQARQPCVLA